MNPPASHERSAPARIGRGPIAQVVMQHVEEAAHLRRMRSLLVRAPHVRLLHLGRLDERIAAHLDGLAVAGADGARLAHQAVEPGVPGSVFVAAVRAIEARDDTRLDALIAMAEVMVAARPGLVSAFGWVPPSELKGIVVRLLDAQRPWWIELGLAACAMHGIHPGFALATAIRSPQAGLRARALQIAGRAGRGELRDECLECVGDADAACAFEAARAALRLGDRGEALVALEALALAAEPGGASHETALCTWLRAASPSRGRALLGTLSKRSVPVRTLIHGIGALGDPHYVPWLIEQMREADHARVAGEAFSALTGLDLAYGDAPEGFEAGPSDDPADTDVAMDEDEGLPWPDPAKIETWWAANAARFTPGTRCFLGEAPTPALFGTVLAAGYQRQRAAAAEHLVLSAPGRPLFDIRAPAWRQQRLLARLSPG